MKALKLAALALLVVVPVLLSACAPECVDYADCNDKAKAQKKEFTCVANVCTAGSPFPPDAGP
jgi:hypothetical protein